MSTDIGTCEPGCWRAAFDDPDLIVALPILHLNGYKIANPTILERWHKYRDRLMAEAGPGRRPSEWWCYEKDLEQPLGAGEHTSALFEMGELSEAELAQLMPRWREDYEKANEPGFGYCTGQLPGTYSAHWVYGAEARRKHFRWAGIPREIIKKWDAERDRRTKRSVPPA